MKSMRWVVGGLLLVAMAAGGYVYWQKQLAARLPDGIVKTNGRIEAEQIDIATKIAGRISAITVDEGDMVSADQIIARLDDTQIKAQLAAAQAQVRQAEQAKAEAEAQIVEREAERDFARQQYERGVTLNQQGYYPTEGVQQRRAQLNTAEAAYNAAVAARDRAIASLEAAHANVAQLSSVLDDTILKAPRAGRIQYKLAQAGEVVAAGGRVATMLDLTDVYMTVFLSAKDAGRLSYGAEARIVLDPAPQYVIPAKVSFVAAEAQFTPKSVETAEERNNLMFRVKLQIPPELLKKNEQRVKTGVRGVAYVRTREGVPWPDYLAINVPE